MENTLNEYINNIIDNTDDIDVLEAVAENKHTDFETKIKAIHKIKKIRNMNLGEKEFSPIEEDEDEIIRFVNLITFKFGFVVGSLFVFLFNILVEGLKQMNKADVNAPVLINKEDKEKDEYIDENKTYSFVDKSKEEDFNKFIEIKSFLSEQLKGDVGRSRINSAILVLEKKFKSNLDLIYKGTTNDEMKQDYISDNNNILSNLKQIIFEYNLKEQELLKEKESKNIEDSFSEIKKYLDLSLLSKES